MNEETLYFYDLETSGVNPRDSRIMQFAGQRTDLDLNPIGEPDNILIKLTDDILPEPHAILVTGITPQATQTDGISEAEFAKYFVNKVATPNTTILGYNSIRFDNEFIRFLLYRNFYDPYEWSYQNNVTMWDLLDVVRMTRALRPEGIEWPYASDGKPSNKLELLTSVNKIAHQDAHDALSDVNATIALAKLIKEKQPKLYDYLYNLRTKQAVERLVTSGEPFVYSSGRYSSKQQKTTVAIRIADHPSYKGRALVYNLAKDPSEFFDLKPEDLVEQMAYVREPDENTPARLPVKELTYNKCPAVAPMGVLSKEACKNINLDLEIIQNNLKKLKTDPTFVDRVVEAFEQNNKQKQQSLVIDIQDVDSRLYDGFFNNHDQKLMAQVRQSSPDELVDLNPNFSDERLAKLLLLYKARQFPKSLTQDEQTQWEAYRQNKLMSGGEDSYMAKYLKNLQELSGKMPDLNKKHLLQELWYWAESIAPVSEDYL